MMALLFDTCFWIAIAVDTAIVARLLWQIGTGSKSYLGENSSSPEIVTFVVFFFVIHIVGLLGGKASS